MMNYKPKAKDIEFELISMAIGEDPALVDKMRRNEDGGLPIIFSVGGVELDFHKVAKMIDNRLNAKRAVDSIKLTNLVIDKAQSLLTEKYSDLINDIVDIQDRIKNQKDKFQYGWEKDIDNSSLVSGGEWTLFILDLDATYNNHLHDDIGVPPLVYLIPKNRLKDVRECAKQAKNDFWSDETSTDLEIDDSFEEYLTKNNIDFKIVGTIELPFGERKDEFLDKNIPIEYV